MADLTFEPPGPGLWQLNDHHFPRPISRYARDIYPDAMMKGVNQGIRQYGFLTEIEVEIVNGYWYTRTHSINSSSESTSDSHLQSDDEESTTAFQQRIARLEETFESKRWRSDLEQWDSDWKPALRARNQALQAVELSQLDDDALIEHLDACRETLWDGIVLHHRMTPCAILPYSDFLAHVREWTDRSPADIVELLNGVSPDSVGVVSELHRAATAVEQDSPARSILFSDTPPASILNQLRTHGGTVQEAIADWLDLAGYRLVSGWDLTEPYGLERPGTLVTTLRKAVEEEATHSEDHNIRATLESIRDEVPQHQREEFDDRFEEARRTYRVRDGRSLLDLRTRGLMRRGLLEAGHRLADRGRLRESNHVVDLQHDELIALIRGGRSPRAAEVAAHVEYRRTHDVTDAPAQLGSEESTVGSEGELPEAAVRYKRAFDVRRWANTPESAADDSSGDEIQGLAASAGITEGRARVVSGPEEFSDIQDGDILVATATSSSFNVVLSLLGGIVTDKGGLLSHPAIVAREFGIPGVVGCEDATKRISDGERIVVDGDEGTVRVVS